MPRSTYGIVHSTQVYPVQNGPATRAGKVSNTLAVVGVALTADEALRLAEALLSAAIAAPNAQIDVCCFRADNRVTVTVRRVNATPEDVEAQAEAA